jgi:hyperosmotically inducible protein
LTRREFCALAFAPVALAQKPVSDDEIYDKVRLRLVSDTAVQGGALEVEVKDGAVTLKGKVRTDKAKEKATRLTKGVKGVKSVDNQLVVSPTG